MLQNWQTLPKTGRAKPKNHHHLSPVVHGSRKNKRRSLHLWPQQSTVHYEFIFLSVKPSLTTTGAKNERTKKHTRPSFQTRTAESAYRHSKSSFGRGTSGGFHSLGTTKGMTGLPVFLLFLLSTTRKNRVSPFPSLPRILYSEDADILAVRTPQRTPLLLLWKRKNNVKWDHWNWSSSNSVKAFNLRISPLASSSCTRNCSISAMRPSSRSVKAGGTTGRGNSGVDEDSEEAFPLSKEALGSPPD